jgi:hypothetical protein
MGAPIFEKCQEMLDIINDFQTKRPELFGDLFKYVYVGMFACGLRVDKFAPAKQKFPLKIEGVKGSKILLNDEKKYLITGYKDSWDNLNPEQKIAIMANMLKRVAFPSQEELEKLNDKGQDYEYGKLNTPDLVDFETFIKVIGLGWNKPGKIIPNILEEDLEI